MIIYLIKCGFWFFDLVKIVLDYYFYVLMLDGMEWVGWYLMFVEIQVIFLNVDYMVMGMGVINYEGVCFGKGYGFFDFEWGMFYQIGCIFVVIFCVVVVYDCQVLVEKLMLDVYDIVVDVIFMLICMIEVYNFYKLICGIIWDCFDQYMFDMILFLQELKVMGF